MSSDNPEQKEGLLGALSIWHRGRSAWSCRTVAGLAALFFGAWAAHAVSWTGGRDIESIRPEEAAPQDPGASHDAPGEDADERSWGPASRDREEADAFGEQLARLWDSIPTYSPVNAKSRLTSRFGWRRGPLSGRREFHGGVDLAAASGTPVVAPAAGTVEASFFDQASGNVVVLKHGNGIETVYGHLDAVLVTAGQDVQRGTAIGRVGTTGWRSTGPHLHYGIRIAQRYVDPERFLFQKRRGSSRR